MTVRGEAAGQRAAPDPVPRVDRLPVGAVGGRVVEARDVRRDYPMGAATVRALRGVSLDILRGEYVAIVGPSGCGKSTLLNLLGVIDRPTSGRILIQGRDVGALPDRIATDFRLRNIGFVFQRFYLLPTLSARENIELPLAEAGVRSGPRAARAIELLTYVGLAARVDHRPAELSGGEQQRVAIARALANRPALVLADEPTGELECPHGRRGHRFIPPSPRRRDDDHCRDTR